MISPRAAALLLCPLLVGCAQTNAALFGLGECKLEKMGDTPLEKRDGLALVNVHINGTPLRLIVDTGAEHTLLSTTAVNRLKLPTDLVHASRSWGVAGPTARYDARVDSFVLAGMKLPVYSVSAGDINVAALTQGADGVLGTDVLRWFDLDLNPAAGQMTLYRGEPCWLKAPPWQEPAVAIAGIEGVRSRIEEPRSLLVPIQLDGAKGMALFDTGSQASGVTLSMAEDAGVHQHAMSSDPKIILGGAGPDTITVPLHRFHSLQVGSWVATNPVLPVLDFPQVDEEDPEVVYRRWQGVIGEDLLRNRRVWISLAGWQIFVSEPAAMATPK